MYTRCLTWYKNLNPKKQYTVKSDLIPLSPHLMCMKNTTLNQ